MSTFVPSSGECPPARFSERLSRQFPLLMAIWLALAVLAPHQEIYKVFFHAIIAPASLTMLFSGRLPFSKPDALMIASLCFFTYAGVTTFFVGLGPVENHFRALRWAIEASFCVLALWAWVPDVVRRPHWWARFFTLVTLAAASLAVVLFVVFGGMEGRLSGLGGLHNPIHASSVFMVYLAIAYFLTVTSGRGATSADRALLFTAFIFVIVAAFFSESRGPLGALAVYLPFLALLEFRAGVKARTVVMVCAAVVGVTGLVALVYGPQHLWEQLLARGTSSRLVIWQGYLQYPPDSWLFGFGLGTESAYVPAAEAFWKPNGIPLYHPHSVYVGTLVETGIIGSGFLLLMIGILLRGIYRSRLAGRDKLRLLGLLGLVFMLTLTASQGVISSIKALWLFLWVPIAFVWVWSTSPLQHNRC